MRTRHFVLGLVIAGRNSQHGIDVNRVVYRSIWGICCLLLLLLLGSINANHTQRERATTPFCAMLYAAARCSVCIFVRTQPEPATLGVNACTHIDRSCAYIVDIMLTALYSIRTHRMHAHFHAAPSSTNRVSIHTNLTQSWLVL